MLLDRLPLFLAGIDQTNFFYANFEHLNLYGYSNIIKVDDDWGFGIHNYFLNNSFKLGLLSTIIVFLIINFFFFETGKYIKNLNYKIDHKIKHFFSIFFLSILIFFGIWSFSGNSFSESVGFFLFFLIGSIHSSLKKFYLDKQTK